MSEPISPVHLGDGLYASFDGYQVTLAANDPINPTDRVWVDLYTAKSLARFLLQCWPDPEEETQQ